MPARAFSDVVLGQKRTARTCVSKTAAIGTHLVRLLAPGSFALELVPAQSNLTHHGVFRRNRLASSRHSRCIRYACRAAYRPVGGGQSRTAHRRIPSRFADTANHDFPHQPARLRVELYEIRQPGGAAAYLAIGGLRAFAHLDRCRTCILLTDGRLCCESSIRQKACGEFHDLACRGVVFDCNPAIDHRDSVDRLVQTKRLGRSAAACMQSYRECLTPAARRMSASFSEIRFATLPTLPAC